MNDFPRSAPSLESERLVLRNHTIDHLADSLALWTDPRVTRHIGGRPFTEEEVWARLLRYVGHWSIMGYGYWAAHEKSSGRFVGEVGFADYKREMTPSFEGAPEIGWVLMPWAHGRGLATEAVRACTAWFDGQFETKRTVCLIDPGNVPSIRVADKCGYVEFARANYKGAPAILFERLRGARNEGLALGRDSQ